MNIKYRSHTFTVAECDLILMGDSFYAKVDIGQRGNVAWHYIKVDPPVAAPIVYTCELPPRAIVLWKPTITLTPELAAHVNHAINVQVQVAA